MKTRVLSALVGIPAVLAAVFAAGPPAFGAILLLLALGALHEYLRLCRVEQPLAGGLLVLAVPALTSIPAGGGAEVAAAVLLALAVLSLWRVENPARRLQSLAEGVLGLAYIGYAMACIWWLRFETAHGAAWLFLVLAATWAGDSVAFIVGSRFGRRRFAAALSPNKTWAGAVGGLAGSVAGACVALPLLGGAVPAAAVGATGLAVGLTGQLGDLFESLWKRAKGVKDSGTLIPGHGGILDRVDSLLLGVPAGYHLARLLGA